LVRWFFEWSLPRFEQTLEALRVLFTPQSSTWASLATGLILAIAFVRSRANVPAAIFLGVSVLGLLSFFYTRYAGYTWHHGLIFVVVFATVWIDRTTKDSAARSSRQHLVPTMLFGAILGFQGYAGVRGIWTDLHRPLSSGREVAHFIAAQGWAADPIIGFPDYTTVTIVGYLGVEQVYYPQGRRWGSFTIWDQRRRAKLMDFDQTIAEIGHSGSAATWIYGAADDDPELERKYGFVGVAKFSGATIENYIVYRRPAGTNP
jgi:hypothetical protein